jgi:hypothetical protein
MSVNRGTTRNHGVTPLGLTMIIQQCNRRFFALRILLIVSASARVPRRSPNSGVRAWRCGVVFKGILAKRTCSPRLGPRPWSSFDLVDDLEDHVDDVDLVSDVEDNLDVGLFPM